MNAEFRHYTDQQVQAHPERLLARHRAAEAERAARCRRETPQQPEPANFCAVMEPEAPRRFEWLDSRLCHGCAALVAVVVLVASWAGWLA